MRVRKEGRKREFSGFVGALAKVDDNNKTTTPEDG